MRHDGVKHQIVAVRRISQHKAWSNLCGHTKIDSPNFASAWVGHLLALDSCFLRIQYCEAFPCDRIAIGKVGLRLSYFGVTPILLVRFLDYVTHDVSRILDQLIQSRLEFRLPFKHFEHKRKIFMK